MRQGVILSLKALKKVRIALQIEEKQANAYASGLVKKS